MIGSTCVMPRAYATSEPAAEPRPGPASIIVSVTSTIAFIVKKYFEKPRSSITFSSLLSLARYSLLSASPIFRRPSSEKLISASVAVCPAGTTNEGRRTVLSGRKFSMRSNAIRCVSSMLRRTRSSSYSAPQSAEYFLYASHISSPFLG